MEERHHEQPIYRYDPTGHWPGAIAVLPGG
jgi:hypothetical protein